MKFALPKGLRGALGTGLMLGLGACVGGEGSTPAQLERVRATDAAAGLVPVPLAVRRVTISVPQSLEVSEAERYYPPGDIVWRGEPFGDRHAQVKRIYEEAARAATAGLTTGRAAVAEVQVTRFHALTNKTRYSVGGVYSLKFELTIRDARSGAVLRGPVLINADAPAAGGQRATDEENAGLSQRKVIVAHLTDVLKTELGVAMLPPTASGR